MASLALPSFARVASAIAIAIAIAACSADARPPASDDLGELRPPIASRPAGDETSTTAGRDEHAGADAGDAGADCKPRTKRECVMKFRGPDGTIIDCKDGFQWCRADGTGWHPCGVYRTGPNGEQLPPD